MCLWRCPDLRTVATAWPPTLVAGYEAAMFAVLWFTLLAGASDAVVVDGEACVEQAAVDEGVAQRVPAGRPGHIEVTVVDRDPADGAVAAQVAFPDGGRRRLSATDCAQLTEQISFVIALWRDPSLVLRPATKTPAPLPPPPPPPPPVAPAPAAAADVVRVAPSPPTRRPLASAVVAAGASSLLVGPIMSVSVRTRGSLWVQGGVRFELSPPQQHGPAVLSLWAPSLHGDACGSLALAWACVGVGGGALVALPHEGLQSPQVGVVPLTTAGASVGASLPFTSTSAVFLEVGARVPLIPMVVAAGDTALWTSPAIAAHVGAGLTFDLL